jgi:hypothetical protein
MEESMRRIVLAVLAATLVSLPGQAALAQDPQAGTAAAAAAAAGPAGQAGIAGLLETMSTCLGYAGSQALPALTEARNYTPSGYGPYGWGPLTQPFGAGPIGPMTAYSPPGLVPAYGPLGPGLTANNIAQSVLPPGGFSFQNPNLNAYANASTLTALGALQQGELGTLYGRYGLGAAFQTAGATWHAAYASEAATTLAVLLALCLNQPKPPAAGAVPTAPTAAMPGSMPSAMPTGMPGYMPGPMPGYMPNPWMNPMQVPTVQAPGTGQ